MTALPEAEPSSASTLRRTTLAAAIGNTVENYDYAVYGFVAAVLAKNFFPDATPGVALLSTFAVFGAAFVVRPLGGLLLGPVADRLGRRPTLVLTLIGMAVVSTLIGLLPTTETIGIAAPILLVVLRMLQGLAAGGEYGTAIIYAAEFAPAHRKGEMASRVQMGSLAGLLIGAFVVVGLNLSLSATAMQSWGWRVPFLLALPLGVIGLYLRSRLGETPEFVAVRGRMQEQPPVDRRVRRALLLIGVAATHAVGFYLAFTYVQNLIIQLHFSAVTATAVVGCALAVGIGLVLAGGRLSDRIGRRRALLIATAVILVVSYPLMAALTAASNPWLLALCAVLLAAGPSFYSGIAPITYIELFPVHSRGTGVALGFNVAVAIFGGSVIYATQWLVQATGDNRAGAFVLIGSAVLSGLTALGLNGVLVPSAPQRSTAVTPEPV
ncbi:MHS family proline/betaine transporter-like MFS transporter [Streptomyces sp. SAI-135]|jgi:MHS family proline/betaine transporter-like MFS transporter|uniref:MFS transporter n=1 Tax=unclassified Streptomyces TaxID=2593676 RepID=UPI0024751266|nr:MULTISPECIES: MFS transporter [unclassified Streptomyces]MDH6523344.1 MHS family proline/betaine transporter-like MFS transporter [Streptomyces sp. SAI-090]MDH6554968.1 MHS family proline/betaine transporter-like MFS transporter [Streptomyces sp. SAI-041]MDH6574234.1 MHS family proline/betaine transporter-like MFS transporter [Streptomyces sp. SAI-117]MDH6581032.1 MHS family proline/betaine transporter-like MFS transporter [Streptomyces sp. SAI-133]MDH6613043.1 MHS family proline/betaine tr